MNMSAFLAKLRGQEVNYPASNATQHAVMKEYIKFSVPQGMTKIQLFNTWVTSDIVTIQTGIRPQKQPDN